MTTAPTSGTWEVTTFARGRGRQQPTRQGELRSVGSALDVLECFSVDGELGVSDIARRLDIAKSTAHRLLTTLCSRRIVEQNPHTGRYRLGIHLYELGHLAQARSDLRQVALPTMSELSRQTGYVVNLSVPDGADVVYIERLEVGPGSKLLAQSGRRLPSHVTSSGKVIAAYNADADRARREAGFPPRASSTIRSLPEWQSVLDDVRRVGYAHADNESYEGISTVAIPLLDLGQSAYAALSLLGPTERLGPQVPALARLLRSAAQRISRSLGR
ncbi:DNA-binding transcriptional regulator, IclR family [Raineyella antarctica]|uniref:Glycerol operon regulatory protein n=1 Tax=Raineyella antarctica TaxID=1577474 RepID=A0A1G6GWZ1_9ACTN|nr:IclR family transcriptional regulator [Raineyella antarctica]SDB86413.1 DNA-binding transcriptional regulator, IclR family [Raineyella antarctica]